MKSTRKISLSATIVEGMQRFNRFVVEAVEHIYASYMERAQMRFAPEKPVRRRMDSR